MNGLVENQFIRRPINMLGFDLIVLQFDRVFRWTEMPAHNKRFGFLRHIQEKRE